jgi:hypothetical protein
LGPTVLQIKRSRSYQISGRGTACLPTGNLFEHSGGGNCEAISDGAVASSKVFDFACSSDNLFQNRRRVISSKKINKTLLFSFDITSRSFLMFWLCKKNCPISSQKFNEIPVFKKFLLNKRWLFPNLNDSIWSYLVMLFYAFGHVQNWTLFSLNGHIMLNAPVLIRSQ